MSPQQIKLYKKKSSFFTPIYTQRRETSHLPTEQRLCVSRITSTAQSWLSNYQNIISHAVARKFECLAISLAHHMCVCVR